MSPRNVDEAIQRKRKEGMPKEPTSVEEPLDLAWLARICPNLQVLLDRAGPNSSRILAFSTGFHLQACADAGTWFLDGTFKVVILELQFMIYMCHIDIHIHISLYAAPSPPIVYLCCMLCFYLLFNTVATVQLRRC